MREWIDMRIWSRGVIAALPPGLGETLEDPETTAMHRRINPRYEPDVHRVFLPRADPRWEDILRLLQSGLRRLWWHMTYTAYVVRRYTRAELAEPELLLAKVRRDFQPVGEQCATIYDERGACRRCGVGRVQRSDLHLALGRLPESRECRTAAVHRIARSLAGELVVSRRFAEAMASAGITGFDLRPVRRCTARAEVNPDWHQLVVTGSAGVTVPPTEFGIDPFWPDKRGRYRCPKHRVSGLNRLSEVHVARAGWDGSDISVTQDLVGWRQGVLRATPLIVVSPRFYRLAIEQGVTGMEWEVVHLA